VAAIPTSLPRGVIAAIPLDVGSGAVGVTAGGPAVWVHAHRAHTLYRIDPAHNRVAARIDLGQDSCGQPVYGAGRLFISPCDGSTQTSVVDTTTSRLIGHIRGSAPGGGLWFGFGSVWVTAQDLHHVIRVDPMTLKPTATLSIPSALFVGDAKSMWFAETDFNADYTGYVDQVDPATNRTLRRIHPAGTVGSGPYIAYASGHLWLMGNDDADLLSISTKTGQAASFKLPGWLGLSAGYDEQIAVGVGSLWIRIANPTVARINPRNGRITRTYPADMDGEGGSPLIAFGSLWVANFSSDTVWRDRI
jgi:streptogramin lyase